MSAVLEQNAALQDHQLKMKRVSAEMKITANVTPASKQHFVDIPGVMILRTEGKVAEADAVESVAFTTADDKDGGGNSVFGMLMTQLGEIEKVYSIKVSEKTALSTSLTVTKHGTSGLTTGGNIAFSVAGAGLDLETESPTIVVEVEYKSK